MRRTIFLYLFLFAALWIVFQFIHNKRYSDNAQRRIDKLEMRLAVKDSLEATFQEKIEKANLFALSGNVNAQEYFEESEKDIDAIILQVSDALIEKNTTAGNILISYKGDNRPFIINSIQLLNHRWIIADFTDGNTWGELLIKYFINEDETIDFEVIDELLH